MAGEVKLFASLAIVSFNFVHALSEPPCSHPESIDHGITDWDGKSAFARYACYQGFHLVGPPAVECRYGKWYSDDAAVYPICKPIVCNHPTIPNGRLETGDNVRYRSGSQASIECDDGYELRNGHGKINCKEDGSWEAVGQQEFPVCKEKPCQYPDTSIPVIENGSLEINGNRLGLNGGYKPGSVALYHCHPGFVLLPLSADKRVCRKGVWEGTIPACVAPESSVTPRRSHCPPPRNIPNGYYLTDRQSEAPLALPVSERSKQYERGTIARYHCQDGYTIRTLHGQDIYRCMANGEWSPKVPPVCQLLEQNAFQDLDEVMCPSPAQIAHTDFERIEGWLTSNGAIHGTVLEYACRIGYRDTRTPCLPTRRTCHAGKWVGNLPSCVPFDYCGRPPSISHGFMVTAPENVYSILTEVHYECHPGYRMKGTDSLKCHATGCWMPNELPQCMREDMFESSWNDSESSSLPLVISLVTVSTGFAVIALFTTSCLVVLCRRKGGSVPPPSGPAHWSTTVTVTPECRRSGGLPQAATSASHNGNGTTNIRRSEQDRMGLIAFNDGVTLPSYEEALRDGVRNVTGNGNGNANTSGLVNGHTRIGSGGTNIATTEFSPEGHRPQGLDLVAATTGSQQQQQQFPIAAQNQDGVGGGRRGMYICSTGSEEIVGNGNGSGICTQTHPHFRQGGRYHARQSSSVAAVATASRRSRSHQYRSHNANAELALDGENGTQGWHRSGHGGRTQRRSGGNTGSSISSGGSPRDNNDTLSDTVSHHSVSSNHWAAQRQPSQAGSASLRSNSAASNGQVISNGPSENTLTTTETSNGQTPSCRALAGSLASFDTSSIVNTEGVPLLEENELETTEGSNSSEPGDSGSATYSEMSNKT